MGKLRGPPHWIQIVIKDRSISNLSKVWVRLACLLSVVEAKNGQVGGLVTKVWTLVRLELGTTDFLKLGEADSRSVRNFVLLRSSLEADQEQYIGAQASAMMKEEHTALKWRM
jgi:hypothetical protein